MYKRQGDIYMYLLFCSDISHKPSKKMMEYGGECFAKFERDFSMCCSVCILNVSNQSDVRCYNIKCRDDT